MPAQEALKDRRRLTNCAQRWGQAGISEFVAENKQRLTGRQGKKGRRVQRLGEAFGGRQAVLGTGEGMWGVLVADEVDKGRCGKGPSHVLEHGLRHSGKGVPLTLSEAFWQ